VRITGDRVSGDRVSGDRATGLVVTSITTPMVLLALLFATQLTVRLHASSTLRSASRVAASAVADDVRAVEPAERQLRATLGPRGADAHVDWSIGPDVILVSVSLEPPSLGAPAAFGLDSRIEHTASVRTERWQ
jgi:hypothetical protein